MACGDPPGIVTCGQTGAAARNRSPPFARCRSSAACATIRRSLFAPTCPCEDAMSQSNDDARWARRRRLREPDVEMDKSVSPLSPADAPPTDDLLPAPPVSVEDSGLDFGFLADLALKTVYADTSCTTQRAAQRLALPP